MAPPDLTIRPLSLGEVIDWAVALTRRHFRVLYPLMILVQVPALPSLGFPGVQFRNIGEIANRGWELDLNGGPVLRLFGLLMGRGYTESNSNNNWRKRTCPCGYPSLF